MTDKPGSRPGFLFAHIRKSPLPASRASWKLNRASSIAPLAPRRCWHGS